MHLKLLSILTRFERLGLYSFVPNAVDFANAINYC